MVSAHLSALKLTLLCALLVKASSVQTRPGPAAHYVIRSSNLRETLEFTSQVFCVFIFCHNDALLWFQLFI